MKQTAVQWLIDEYFGGMENCTPDFQYYINKALEMEKEQIMQAFANGKINGDKNWPQKYYKETYEAQEN